MNPGKELDDLEFSKMRKELVTINESSRSPVKNNFLIAGNTLEENRKLYDSCVIALMYFEDEAFGFLISPIIHCSHGPILHAGLVIINKNPGANCISYPAIQNMILAYESLGTIYSTNISSTPSIIESFDNIVHKAWPSPSQNAKLIPKNYKDVVKALEDEYIKKYFVTDDLVEIDSRRFTMSSNSNGMGFSTNFYKLARAEKFIYQTFCMTWIDHSKGEDIVQVGKIGFLTNLYQRGLLFMLKISLLKLKKKGSGSGHETSKKEDTSKTKVSKIA